VHIVKRKMHKYRGVEKKPDAHMVCSREKEKRSSKVRDRSLFSRLRTGAIKRGQQKDTEEKPGRYERKKCASKILRGGAEIERRKKRERHGWCGTQEKL